MIDYHSTDGSRKIRTEMCPTWEVHTTRNTYFESAAIDREIEDYENRVTGWRIALNATEFLYGNIRLLEQINLNAQVFIGNYVFIDRLDEVTPHYGKPLHEQRKFGYREDRDTYDILSTLARASRSMHNYTLRYDDKGGRHWRQKPSYQDIWIFYYGMAILNRDGIARKMQIKGKMDPKETQIFGGNHPNSMSQDLFINTIDRYHRPRCKDLTSDIDHIVSFM